MQAAILLDQLPYRHLFFNNIQPDMKSQCDDFIGPNDNYTKEIKHKDSNDPTSMKLLDTIASKESTFCQDGENRSPDDGKHLSRTELRPLNVTERIEIVFLKTKCKIRLNKSDLLYLKSIYNKDEIISGQLFVDRAEKSESETINRSQDGDNGASGHQQTNDENVHAIDQHYVDDFFINVEETFVSVNMQSKTIPIRDDKQREFSKKDVKNIENLRSDKNINSIFMDENLKDAEQFTPTENISREMNNDEKETVMVRFGSTDRDNLKRDKDLRWEEGGLCVVFSDPVVCATYEANDLAEDLRKLRELLDSLDRN